MERVAERTVASTGAHVARRGILVALAGALVILFVAGGALGLTRYLRGYWRYRGFPPPKDPAFVRAAGTSEKIFVTSAALGGRRQEVDVYLPPGYAANPQERYPVFYLLHGFPGRPKGTFLWTTRLGVVEDVLLAKHLTQPVILAMPFGSTGTFTDKEWANGIRPHEGWETFVARDVVRAIDAHYRTVATGSGRALGGLSEGGYGALNIGLHHPGEFRVLESWSGYELADNLKSIFDGKRRLLDDNSPMVTVKQAAPSLRRAHTYVWFYSGSDDSLRAQNAAFARELTRLGIAHQYLLIRGGHNWALWRGNSGRALLAASTRLASE